MNERGLGLIEIVIVLAVVALAGYLLMQYFGATARTVEKFQQDRPLGHGRLAADQATLATLQTVVRTYQVEKGHWPPDKGAVLGLVAGPPRFQCPGNDIDYDPASGSVNLTITDAARC